MNLIKGWPFTMWAVLGLLFWIVSSPLHLHYDDPGARGVMYWFGQIVELPFRLAGELIMSFGNGHAVKGIDLWALLIAFAICGSLDALIRKLSLRRR